MITFIILYFRPIYLRIKHIHFVYFWVIILLIPLSFSCKIQQKAEKAGKGVAQGLKSEDIDAYIAETVRTIVENTREDLLGKPTQDQVDSLLQAVTTRLNSDVNNISRQLRDSLLNEYTSLKIQSLILSAGEDIDYVTGNLRENLLGKRTKLLVGEIRTELLGDSTLMAAAALRNELLGDKTKALVDSLLRNSITSIATGFKNEIQPQIRETLGNVDSTAKDVTKYLAIALGVMLLVVIIVTAIIWNKFRTRKKIMTILTQEIDRIEDQKQYDALVKNIQQKAVAHHVEPDLQKILKEDRDFQEAKWKNANERLIKALSDQLKEKSVNIKADLPPDLREHWEKMAAVGTNGKS